MNMCDDHLLKQLNILAHNVYMSSVDGAKSKRAAGVVASTGSLVDNGESGMTPTPTQRDSGTGTTTTDVSTKAVCEQHCIVG